mgnify:CR=1 FL=1
MLPTSYVKTRKFRLPALLFALVVSFSLFAPSTSRAGAWAQEDKGLYAKISVARSTAKEQYKETGETFQLLSEDEKGSFSSWGMLMYGEFGLLPKLTVTMSTSILSGVIESDLVRIRTTGMTDFRTGLRFQFLDKPLVMSVATNLTVPTGYTPDPPTAKTPTLGLGVPMYEGSLLVGKSFYPVPVYVSVQGGFRARGSRLSRGGEEVDYPPEIPYFAEIGVSPLDWLLIRGVLNGVHGLGDPLALDAFSLSPTTQSYMKAGPSAIVTIKDHFQLNFDYLYTVTGINSVKSHDFTIGFAVDYSL